MYGLQGYWCRFNKCEHWMERRWNPVDRENVGNNTAMADLSFAFQLAAISTFVYQIGWTNSWRESFQRTDWEKIETGATLKCCEIQEN